MRTANLQDTMERMDRLIRQGRLDPEKCGDALLRMTKANHPHEPSPAHPEGHFTDQDSHNSVFTVDDFLTASGFSPHIAQEIGQTEWLEIRRVGRKVGVTVDEFASFYLIYCGYTIRDIARYQCCRWNTVKDRAFRCAVKLLDANEFYIIEVLAEVFSMPKTSIISLLRQR